MISKLEKILDIEIDIISGFSKTDLKFGEACEYEDRDETRFLESHYINFIANLTKRSDLFSFEKTLIRRKKSGYALQKTSFFDS